MGGAISALAFPAPNAPLEYYEDELLQREDLLELTTDHNEPIPAIHCLFKGDQRQHRRRTILYSHGNAEDLGDSLDYIDALASATCCDVFAYDYVGYSLNRLNAGGAPSEAGCIRSIETAWRHCVDTLGIPPASIVLFGRSIGSGPTVDLASRAVVPGTTQSPLDASGVLLMSPIESGARAVLGKAASIVGYPLDIFRNYEKVGRITTKTAIMHGTADEVVPCSNGRQLHSWLQDPAPPLWLEGYGHNNMPQARCFTYASEFIAALPPAPSR